MAEKSEGMSFWEHIAELRKRVKVILIMLVGSTVFFLLFPANPADFFSPQSFFTGVYKPAITLILGWMKDYIAPNGLQIISLEMGAPLEVYSIAAIVFALIASSPVIGYEFFKFVDPALKHDERRAIYPFVTGFTTLFLTGAVFGFFVLAPFMTYTLIIFSQFVGSEPVISVMDFYSMTLTTVAFTGIAFTTPAIFVILAKFKVVKTSLFTKNRKYVYAGLFIVIAIVTTGGGPLVDAALFVPMVILMEAAVYISKRYDKPAESSIKREEPKCRFCGRKMKPSGTFCPKCHKSAV